MNKLNPITPSNGDYIGKLVKRFESGTKGCTTISQCGNDWGYSFGSYQLTARWGNALAFFKKYYGVKYSAQLAMVQYYGPDFIAKTDPGMPYCLNMNVLAQLWALEAAADPINMEINERKYIQENYYEKALKNLGSFNPNLYNRAIQECMWSWAVHKSGTTAGKTALSIINSVDLNSISAEELFDKFYDHRYSVNAFNRYKKGLANGSSERETLRTYINQPPLQFIGIGTSSFNTSIGVNPISNKVSDNIVSPQVTAKPIYRVRLTWSDTKSQQGAFVDINLAKKCADGKPGYSVFSPTGEVLYTSGNNTSFAPYLFRAKATLNVRSTPDSSLSSNIVGSINETKVYTIIEEKNGFGKLKSGVGWVSLAHIQKVNK